MQGREGMDRTFLGAAGLVGHLIDPGSVFAFLAEYRGRLFPEEVFADLFPSGRGAESIPGSVMASVMTLQTLHDTSDRETAEAVRSAVEGGLRAGVGRCGVLSVHVGVLAASAGCLGSSVPGQRCGQGGDHGDRGAARASALGG
jgi:hypothetical protein